EGDGRRILDLFSYLYHSEDYREQAGKLAEASSYSYEEKGIGREAAKALYGNILQGSVTRLEQYASCAYAHFLRYGLELLERREYELGSVDMGNLFHQSLDFCFEALGEKGIPLTELSPERRQALVQECVTRAAENYGNTILHSSSRNEYLIRRISRITERTMWALGEQMKKSEFHPAGFEVSFSAADNLNAMKIALSEEEALYLKGRIDRLDLCEDETHVYVKIIDYKSGGTSFDLAALYYGLQLQLVVYMDAALEMEERRHPGKEVVPAGLFYYHIQDPMVEKKDEMTAEEIEAQIKKQLKMNGLVNSDLEVIRKMDREIEGESDVIPVALKSGVIQEAKSSVASGKRFWFLRDYVRSRCRKAGQEILDGDIRMQPYKQGNRTGCDYCPYHAVCGFDRKAAGYGYRKLRSIKPEEIWKEILPEEEEEAEEAAGREERS
ncbi:MAG: PD-(D/E)XK nuclease family protein, partial [Lachnospiraceae bacterium]|nr:PD-(D/E)XK nuclease family protein [Lachnospiraceae bacterium]